MATKHIYLKDLHFDHKVWTNELKFYKEELALLEGRLGEVVNKNTDATAMAKAEHYQNQFIRQNEVVDTLVHDIKLREEKLVAFAKEHTVATDHMYFDDKQEEHEAMADRMETFKKIYANLKADFMSYAGEWM